MISVLRLTLKDDPIVAVGQKTYVLYTLQTCSCYLASRTSRT